MGNEVIRLFRSLSHIQCPKPRSFYHMLQKGIFDHHWRNSDLSLLPNVHSMFEHIVYCQLCPTSSPCCPDFHLTLNVRIWGKTSQHSLPLYAHGKFRCIVLGCNRCGQRISSLEEEQWIIFLQRFLPESHVIPCGGQRILLVSLIPPPWVFVSPPIQWAIASTPHSTRHSEITHLFDLPKDPCNLPKSDHWL